MGVYFAIRNRDWKQLLLERARRILLPFVIGFFLIVPLHVYIWQSYYQFDPAYWANPGHLWFLGNIFVYVVVLSPIFFYLKRNGEGAVAKFIKRILCTPLGLIPVMAMFIVEALIVDPRPYEMYAMTWHGFYLGLLSFFFGFCFVLAGQPFWGMILKWRWLFLVAAMALFTVRLFYFHSLAPNYLISIESNCWIIAVFAFGHKYLDRPGKALRYLSEAAYPVYIVHMIVLYLGSMLLFPLDMAPPLQFVFLLAFTGIGCFILYELVIRRINFLRPLFGLKRK
jgi:peptidoglycan/LPS O-acetylase OafA/YrhL